MTIKFKVKNIEMLLIFITGFIVGTHWAEYILSKIGINFFLFEIFLLPYFMYKRNTIYNIFKKKHKLNLILVFFFFVLISGVLFGTINSNNDIMSVLTTTRPLFYMILIIAFFSSIENINIDKLYSWSIATILGEIIFILLIYRDISPGRMWFYVNSITLALLVIIPIVQRKFIRTTISIILALFISIISGYRINLVILGLSLFVAMAWRVLCKEKVLKYKIIVRKISILVFMTFIPIFVVKFYKQLIEVIANIFKMNPVSIYRITGRLEFSLSGDIANSQDNIRIELYKKIYSEFTDNIIPNGLIGKTMGYTGLYTDVPLLFLYESIGSILTIIVVIFLGFIGIASFINAFRGTSLAFDTVCGLMAPIIIVLLVINGTFMYFANVSIITGIILSRWINRRAFLIKSKKYNCKY